jgi:beta-lactamase superfamily II metal-dependent hydrolase
MARERQTTPIILISALIVLVAGGIIAYRFFVSPYEAPATGNATTDDSVPAPVVGTLEAAFLDVGEADSAVLRCGSAAMLIDAGGNGGAENLVQRLKSLGIDRFEAVIATHPDADHIGGLDVVVDAFDIGRLYMPNDDATTETFMDAISAIRAKGLTISDPIRNGHLRFRRGEYLNQDGALA